MELCAGAQSQTPPGGPSVHPGAENKMFKSSVSVRGELGHVVVERVVGRAQSDPTQHLLSLRRAARGGRGAVARSDPVSSRFSVTLYVYTTVPERERGGRGEVSLQESNRNRVPNHM